MKKIIPLFLALFLFGACATLFSSSDDEITFESDPPGADVYQGKVHLGKTPVTVSVDREFSKTYFLFQKDGYTDFYIKASKDITTSAFFNFGFITTFLGSTSWGLDLLTGNLMEYKDQHYVAQLKKSKTSQLEFQNRKELLQYVLKNIESLRKELAKLEPKETWNGLTKWGIAPERAIFFSDRLLQSKNSMEFYREVIAL